MPFDLLLPLATYPDPTPRAGLRPALELAATLDGRVTSLVHEVTIPRVTNALAEVLIDISAMTAQAEALSRSTGVALTAEIIEVAGKLQLPLELTSIRCGTEQAPDRIAAAARTYDLTLLVRDVETPSAVEEAVLFGSGGPVILLPPTEATVRLDRIVVAWDGNRAAARAVRDALPMLVMARSVLVVTLGDDKPISPQGTTGIRRLLEHHGIAAAYLDRTRGDKAIGDALQDIAVEERAGLLVMGAYGHNRLREFVLGGATRSILRSIRLPVLMSH